MERAQDARTEGRVGTLRGGLLLSLWQASKEVRLCLSKLFEGLGSGQRGEGANAVSAAALVAI